MPLNITSKKGGYLYLQKRSKNKDIQPGKWDTSVGGHVDYGESIETALLREAYEELGIKLISPKKLVCYIFCSDIEQEMINVYFMVVDDNFECVYDNKEIDDARFWHIDEINKVLGKGILTPNFEQEFSRIKHLII